MAKQHGRLVYTTSELTHALLAYLPSRPNLADNHLWLTPDKPLSTQLNEKYFYMKRQTRQRSAPNAANGWCKIMGRIKWRLVAASD